MRREGRCATDRPPVVRISGLPVRVMCTSEMDRRCRALLAILGAVDRTAVGREAMVAGGGCGMSQGGLCRGQLTLTDAAASDWSFIQFKPSKQSRRRGLQAQAHSVKRQLGIGQSETRDPTRLPRGTYREHQAALPRQAGAGCGCNSSPTIHHQLPPSTPDPHPTIPYDRRHIRSSTLTELPNTTEQLFLPAPRFSPTSPPIRR